MASYTINTDHKTIEYAGCDKAEAILFAQLHEFEGYTLRKDLPGYNVSYYGTFNNPEPFNPDKVLRGILGEKESEYLEETVIGKPSGYTIQTGSNTYFTAKMNPTEALRGKIR